MSIMNIDGLKNDLSYITTEKPNKYVRINQDEAAGLLREIEQLERENSDMKEKLAKINELSKL
jgi:hypothetical protein